MRLRRRGPFDSSRRASLRPLGLLRLGRRTPGLKPSGSLRPLGHCALGGASPLTQAVGHRLQLWLMRLGRRPPFDSSRRASLAAGADARAAGPLDDPQGVVSETARPFLPVFSECQHSAELRPRYAPSCAAALPSGRFTAYVAYVLGGKSWL
jgi:hypothetical protein